MKLAERINANGVKISSTNRNSDEFNIHLNFDEQNPGCSWGSDIPPSTVYQSEFGITFSNGPSSVSYTHLRAHETPEHIV